MRELNAYQIDVLNQLRARGLRSLATKVSNGWMSGTNVEIPTMVTEKRLRAPKPREDKASAFAV